MNLFDFIPHDGSEITLDELSKKLGGANKELLGVYTQCRHRTTVN